ncbi:MAG: 50S ribosomal protein L10 [Holophagales bacterium]|jgi:large subunit ribosomal protein L10|nr:50S ribosomal protein L10 [Holophagales bacterium]
MDRIKKQNEIKELKGTFASAKSAVILGFKGLTVDKDTVLRRTLRESKAHYRVSKNTLLRLAVKETSFEPLTDHFKGATAVATSDSDVVGLAKTIYNFLKENPTVTFKGAILDGQLTTVKDFQTIAELPSRETLIGKLLYLMQYPISGLAVALDQIRQKKEEAGS